MQKMVNDTVLISGVVISPNYQTSNRSYYIYDGTAGINLFSSGLTGPDLQLGDSVVVVGEVTEYYGNLEINTFSDADIVVAGTKASLPKPKLLTIKEYNTNGGNYQSELISFSNLSKVSGSWPTSKKNVTLKFTDGTDTLTVYLDSDMGLYNSPEPKWPADMQGISALYSSSGKLLMNYIHAT